jgi:hypothetical protein
VPDTFESTLELPLFGSESRKTLQERRSLAEDLAAFREFGSPTRCLSAPFSQPSGQTQHLPVYVNEFWTARQRAANSLHEISYRACFKPQLPRFFIQRLTSPGDRVYDPFMGRGTTLIESALLGRNPVGCDVNPLSIVLTHPRLHPPALEDIRARLGTIDLADAGEQPDDLLAFYHPETLRHISALRKYLLDKGNKPQDAIDHWIQLVALNRLTGHSSGFFSVYTMPPNQAVSVKSQRKINEQRKQTPPRRDISAIILKKSASLLTDCGPAERKALRQSAQDALLLTAPCDNTPEIPSNSVALVVTSPPFLNIVDYAGDNWLRCWFLGIDPKSVRLTVPHKLNEWQVAMTRVFLELARVLQPGGHISFEVGEVHSGNTRLEEAVIPCGCAAGLKPLLVMINHQEFTKTANCWGVDNNSRGTNTNRIVVFQKS